MDRAQLAVSLRDAWRDVLEVEVADDSDFYEQGGSSLTAAEAMLEETWFESVVDAICSELGVPQSDPAPPAAPR